jgi:hypothetical protein
LPSLCQLKTSGDTANLGLLKIEPSEEKGSCRREASCAWEHDFAIFGKPSGVTESLHYVLALQIRVLSEKFVNATTSSDLTDNHSDGNPHSTNAWLTAHYTCIMSDSIERGHGDSLRNRE